jgi:hypothetical protein
MSDHQDGVCHFQMILYSESAAITAPACPSHYAPIRGASLLLLHSGFGLQPRALQLSNRLSQMGHFLSRASGSPFAHTRHVSFLRPCTQTLRPKHLVQFTARVMPLLSGQVHLIWPSCRSRRRSRAPRSRGQRKHETYLACRLLGRLGRRGLLRRCGLRLGGKLVALLLHGTRNCRWCLVGTSPQFLILWGFPTYVPSSIDVRIYVRLNFKRF